MVIAKTRHISIMSRAQRGSGEPSSVRPADVQPRMGRHPANARKCVQLRRLIRASTYQEHIYIYYYYIYITYYFILSDREQRACRDSERRRARDVCVEVDKSKLNPGNEEEKTRASCGRVRMLQEKEGMVSMKLGVASNAKGKRVRIRVWDR
jgi:hypothetical protein